MPIVVWLIELCIGVGENHHNVNMLAFIKCVYETVNSLRAYTSLCTYTSNKHFFMFIEKILDSSTLAGDICEKTKTFCAFSSNTAFFLTCWKTEI